ncbi:MAG: ribonuclease HII [Hyphomicrobiaceae bacterium]
MAIRATFELEENEAKLGRAPIAGVDEAGRGPWAGPVVAAAVILDMRAIPDGIADSKTVDPDMRDQLYTRIVATSAVGVGIADVDRIDRDNILNATLWAMSEAVRSLGVRPRLALVDGNRSPKLSCETRTVVRGDALCLSIAAASIIAKVTRDRLMIELARSWPDYGFDRHKGYGTPEHKAALARHGATPLHRRSFRPVQLVLGLSGASATTAQAPALEISSQASRRAKFRL